MAVVDMVVVDMVVATEQTAGTYNLMSHSTHGSAQL